MATLTERLAVRAKKTATEKGRGRSAFLALKSEIQSALKEGWNAKEIWSLLKDEGKIGVSYSVFIRYIREYIRDQGEGDEPVTATPPLVKSTQQPADSGATGKSPSAPSTEEKRTRQAPALPGNFNLASQPDKGSLV